MPSRTAWAAARLSTMISSPWFSVGDIDSPSTRMRESLAGSSPILRNHFSSKPILPASASPSCIAPAPAEAPTASFGMRRIPDVTSVSADLPNKTSSTPKYRANMPRSVSGNFLGVPRFMNCWIYAGLRPTSFDNPAKSSPLSEMSRSRAALGSSSIVIPPLRLEIS